MCLKECGKFFPVPYVDIPVLKPRGGSLQTREVPQCVSLGAEKLAPHVVVDAKNLMALPLKIFDSF
jgi:hypothetical protein